MPGNEDLMLWVTASLLGVALLFHIIGLATTGWIIQDSLLLDIKSGLWKVCVGGTCNDISYTKAWLTTCRALGIIGLLAIAVFLVFAVLTILKKDNRLLNLLTAAAAAVAILSTMMEFSIYSGKNYGLRSYFGYSFALTIVACVLSAVATVLFVLARKSVLIH